MYYIILAEIAKAVFAPSWVVCMCYVLEALDFSFCLITAYLRDKKK